MVILVTSSSSSKTEFTRIFYDVFDVGGFAGSSLLEVSLLYLLGIPSVGDITTGRKPAYLGRVNFVSS